MVTLPALGNWGDVPCLDFRLPPTAPAMASTNHGARHSSNVRSLLGVDFFFESTVVDVIMIRCIFVCKTVVLVHIYIFIYVAVYLYIVYINVILYVVIHYCDQLCQFYWSCFLAG